MSSNLTHSAGTEFSTPSDNISMKDTDIAWVAGIIDGEGSVSGTWINKEHTRWKPVIAVDNTDLPIIETLVSLFGGSVVKKKKVIEHHRQCYTWRVHGTDQIISFLETILPYMRVESKRERAQLLINEYRNLTPRNGYYTDKMRADKLDFIGRYYALGTGRGSSGRYKQIGDCTTLEK